MYVAHLSLCDFRSYPALELALEPGAAAFVGPNAHGKTNLLEALEYVATLSSHRVNMDGPLVRQGAARAVLRADVVRDGRSTRIELEVNPGKANRARLNRSPVSRPHEVAGILRTVVFAPEDLALIRGDPADRRRFLDDLLVARAPRYAAVRADYERVLKQRGALLKTAGMARRAGARGDWRTLEVWDTHLAQRGAALLAGRLELVEVLRPLVDKAYTAVAAGAGPVGLDYRSSVFPTPAPSADPAVLATALLAELARLRDQEVDRGVNLVGPHRDELMLSIGDFPARGFASHGESWSLALALRLASYELLTSDGSAPVLLLDDVFAELDTGRRDRLAELAGTAEQVLVTAAVAGDVPGQLSGARYDVANGQVSRVC